MLSMGNTIGEERAHPAPTSRPGAAGRRSVAVTRRTRIAGLAGLAGLAALAIVMAGCTAPLSGSGPDSGAAGGAAAAQAEAFPDVYAQTIDWRDCTDEDGLDEGFGGELNAVGVDPEGIRCGTVRAPLDWDDPSDDDRIDLAVVHIPATGDDPLGTLMGNPGGPGEPGVGFMLGMPLSPGIDAVLERYDLLGFDPRGIGNSTPLECYDTGSELPAVQLGLCAASQPIAHTMGTSQVARDMELMRSLIGAAQLDFLGYSYGTMLGASYATLFPEHTGRMVLDSAENAEWASPIHSFDQAVAGAKATVALATACRTEYADEVEVCPFVDEDSLVRVLTDLDAEPLVTTQGTTIDGGDLKSYLIQTLYQSHFERGRTLDRVALALFGDQDAIDEIGGDTEGDQDVVDESETAERDPNLADPVDLTMEVVSCHSFPIDPDIPGLIAHIQKTGIPRLLGGPEITDDTLESFVDFSCYALPGSGLDITDRFDAAGAQAPLVIGITGDHATPYQYAQDLVDELGVGRLLTLDGQGHAASFAGRSACIDTAVTEYLLEGTLPKEGTVCQDD